MPTTTGGSEKLDERDDKTGSGQSSWPKEIRDSKGKIASFATRIQEDVGMRVEGILVRSKELFERLTIDFEQKPRPFLG